MRSIALYEPAMCCPTGLCGVGVDPELLRISTVLNALEKRGIAVERFNLTSAPMKFLTNKTVNKAINELGMDGLPFTLVDGDIVITRRYPTNQELAGFLDIPVGSLEKHPKDNV